MIGSNKSMQTLRSIQCIWNFNIVSRSAAASLLRCLCILVLCLTMETEPVKHELVCSSKLIELKESTFILKGKALLLFRSQSTRRICFTYRRRWWSSAVTSVGQSPTIFSPSTSLFTPCPSMIRYSLWRCVSVKLSSLFWCLYFKIKQISLYTYYSSMIGSLIGAYLLEAVLWVRTGWFPLAYLPKIFVHPKR